MGNYFRHYGKLFQALWEIFTGYSITKMELLFVSGNFQGIKDDKDMAAYLGTFIGGSNIKKCDFLILRNFHGIKHDKDATLEKVSGIRG